MTREESARGSSPSISGVRPNPSVAKSARSETLRLLLGLLVTPVVVGTAVMTLPHLHVGVQVADAMAFGGAASTTMVALAIVSMGEARLPIQIAIAVAAAAALGILAWMGVTSAFAAVVVDAALVAVAWAIGAAIGRRIEHPGHLLPACVVVASADATSVVSQFGPTHAIAENARALSVVAVSFPVPGVEAFAPALGVGDLVFVAIVLGALSAHRLSVPRAATLACLGALVAGALSAFFGTAVPALVPIGVAIVLGVPEARKLRSKDRRAASVAMAIAVSVAAAVIVAQLVHPASEDDAK